MAWWRTMRSGIHGLMRKDVVERDFDDELRDYLDRAAEEHRMAGLDDIAAMRGGESQSRKRCGDQGRSPRRVVGMECDRILARRSLRPANDPSHALVLWGGDPHPDASGSSGTGRIRVQNRGRAGRENVRRGKTLRVTAASMADTCSVESVVWSSTVRCHQSGVRDVHRCTGRRVRSGAPRRTRRSRDRAAAE